MPTDAELRALFQDAELGAPTSEVFAIDTAAVIRHSKRRRLPRQLGAGSVLTLAVAGIGFASINGLRAILPSPITGASLSAAESTHQGAADAPLPGSSHGTTVAPESSGCGQPAMGEAPAVSGLQLTAAFPRTAPATGDIVVGTVTITNRGPQTLRGTVSSPPTITVTDDDRIAVRHTMAGPVKEQQVTLAVGESIDFEASFRPMLCATDDGTPRQGEMTDASPVPLDPGRYQLSAAIDVVINGGPALVISSPPTAITFR